MKFLSHLVRCLMLALFVVFAGFSRSYAADAAASPACTAAIKGGLSADSFYDYSQSKFIDSCTTLSKKFGVSVKAADNLNCVCQCQNSNLTFNPIFAAECISSNGKTVISVCILGVAIHLS